jgi:hypothetical protein
VPPRARLESGPVALTADELEKLADLNAAKAERYRRAIAFMDRGAEGRSLAAALAEWRRERARYFRGLAAEVERAEATVEQGARSL